MGRLGLAIAVWGGWVVAVALFWGGMILSGGSKLIPWAYILILLAAYLGCACWYPKRAGPLNLNENWKAKGLTLLAIIAWIALWSALSPGIQYRITATSMEPALKVGDCVIADPFSYRVSGHGPARGDVVVHRAPDHGRTLFIHRVLGIPGDKIKIIQGDVYLNGAKLEQACYRKDVDHLSSRIENYRRAMGFCDQGKVPPEYCRTLRIDYAMNADSVAWSLPPGGYFVAGDNFWNSMDSKYYGYLDRNMIEARAVCHGITSLRFDSAMVAKMGNPVAQAE